MKLTRKQADLMAWRASMQLAKTAPDTKKMRREAGMWLKELRAKAELSQIELADVLGLKYYTFISQVENGFGRVPTESMEAWARALSQEPAAFAKKLLSYYDPEMYRLLFEVKK
jgi:transcriptional regulator with XRE-family HTH domain